MMEIDFFWLQQFREAMSDYYGNLPFPRLGAYNAMAYATRGPIYKYELTLISARICNYIQHKAWDAIIYWFPNFNGATVEVCEWIS